MRNCYFGSEFWRPVSLLLAVTSSHRLSVIIFVTELLNWLFMSVVPELMGVLQHPEHPPGYATACCACFIMKHCTLGRR